MVTELKVLKMLRCRSREKKCFELRSSSNFRKMALRCLQLVAPGSAPELEPSLELELSLELERSLEPEQSLKLDLTLTFPLSPLFHICPFPGPLPPKAGYFLGELEPELACWLHGFSYKNSCSSSKLVAPDFALSSSYGPGVGASSRFSF